MNMMSPSLAKSITLYSLFCVYFMAAFILPKSSHAASPDFGSLKKTGTATIVSVIDPYRLNTDDGRIIRLAAIDIPDYHPERSGEISLMAMRVLDDMLTGKTVTLYQSKNKLAQTNRMGHFTAHLKTENNIWVQGLLLDLGLSRVQTDYELPHLSKEMLALEQKARESKTGLWSYDGFQILTPDTADKYLDSFQIVEGTIHAAAMKNNRVYLNFGENWREDFTVSIPPLHRRKFSKAGLDPLALGKAKVRVRGWLQDYNGPYIEITHPEALEILSTPATTIDTP